MTLSKNIKYLFSYEALALFLMIYASNDTLLFGTNGDSVYVLGRYVIAFVLFLWGIFKKDDISVFNHNNIVIVFLLVSFFFLNSLLTGFHFGFLYNIFLLLIAITYSKHVKVGVFILTFKKIVYLLALFSLVVYFINLIFPASTSILPIHYNSEGYSFRFAGLTMIYDELQMRNFGIFREPGVFMIYLNIALFCELFSVSPSTKRIITYLITILTTISTAGFIIAALIIAVFVLFSKRYKLLIALIPIVLLAYYCILNMPNISILLFEKLHDPTYSTYARLSSLTVPIDIWKNNLLGAGPNMYDKLFPIFSSIRYGVQIDPRDSTNTMLKFLSVYGPFVFTFILFYLYKFTQLFSKRSVVNVSFFIILLIASSNEDLRDSIFFYLFIAYGIRYSLIKNTVGDHLFSNSF